MLTDFGQSRASNYSQPGLRTSAYDLMKGTANWMAYELLAFFDDMTSGEVICTKETDMWAFGMVVYVSQFHAYACTLYYNIHTVIRRLPRDECRMSR